MSFNIENFLKNSLLNLEYTKEIIGSDEFLNALEHHYFSSVIVKRKCVSQDSLDLVLEVNCNLDLMELFYHFNTDRWGTNVQNESPMQHFLEIVNLKNNFNVDIEELTISLNDTSIVIKRIYQKSIPTQFNEILKSIASNYVFITKGLTQKPYEIFVPIFEDSIESGELDYNQIDIFPKTYREFWGIYLGIDEEASIYDVKRNTYVSGDLEFLND